MIYTHDLSPIALSLFGLGVRWYSLAYLIGFAVGYVIVKQLRNPQLLNDKNLEKLFNYMIIGVILGGRLGYVIIYNFAEYIKHPLSIIKVWEGGMSFHGAIIGVALGIYLFSRSTKVPIMHIADLISTSCCTGIGLGRIANFINGELWGRHTEGEWGVIFPMSGDLIPRHPSQLYEALLEGLLLGVISLALTLGLKLHQKRTGFSAGIWIIFYSLSRLIIEFFREPDPQIGFILGVTMGQILSIIMLSLGIFMLYKSNNIKPKKQNN